MVKLANGLAADHRVDLLLVRAEGPYLQEVSADVNVIDLGARRTITAILPLVRHLRDRRPDAVLSALRHVNVMAILARAMSRVRCCLVVSERNMVALSAHSTPRRRDRLFVILIPLFYPMADAVVAIASDIREELLTRLRVPQEKLHLIYNPIVDDELLVRAAEPIDESWWQRDVPNVLAVGRLTEHKNYQLLITSFARVREEQDARLVILGEGPERKNLEDLARNLGIEDSVRLPGLVSNVYKFMRHSDLFVHTSRWEGLPGVLIEALACSVPIVATDAPGGSGEVLEHGRHGRLVASDDESALAEAIREGLRGGIPAPDRASWSRFEQASVVTEYEAVFRSCARDPS